MLATVPGKACSTFILTTVFVFNKDTFEEYFVKFSCERIHLFHNCAGFLLFFYASFVNVPNSLESVTSRSQLHVFEFCMPARVIDLRISQMVVTANGFL